MKILFDITDLWLSSPSSGHNKVQEKLAQAFEELQIGDKFEKFIIEESQYYAIENGAKRHVTIENLKNYGETVLISTGHVWINPVEMPRLSFFELLKKETNIKFVLTSPSLIGEKIPQWSKPSMLGNRENFLNFLHQSTSLILFFSKHSMNDYKAYESRLNVEDANKLKLFELGDDLIISQSNKYKHYGDFILYVSTLERRKNHEVIYRAYRWIYEQGFKGKLPNVVFAGRKRWGVDQLLHEITNDPLVSHHFKILEYVSDDDLLDLYSNCLYTVYPSHYEGWGLPVGESLSLGKPVLCSSASSLPEVGRDNCDYLDPYDTISWAKKILSLQETKNLKALYTKSSSYQKRTWQECARQILNHISTI